MGVVRQAVKRSAGNSGFMGSSSFAPHDASWIQFFTDKVGGIAPLVVNLCLSRALSFMKNNSVCTWAQNRMQQEMYIFSSPVQKAHLDFLFSLV